MSAAIRPARPSDAAALAELGASTFASTFAHTTTAEDLERFLAATYSPERQGAELADPRVAVLVAVEPDGEALVGYAMLREGPAPACVAGERPLELARLYTRQTWIGRGLGAALLARSCDDARARGFRTLWLGVWEHNHRALAFYGRHGFRDVGSHTFMLGGDAQTDRLMQLAL
jgi:ribosomal protein S18 acetylase RimI-like enzyme